MDAHPKGIEIRWEGTTLRASRGTTVADIFGPERIQDDRIVAAVLNHHLVSLHTRLDGDAQLQAVKADQPEAFGIVRRTTSHALHALVARRQGELRITVGQSLLGGHFYEVHPALSEKELQALAAELTQELEALAAAELPLDGFALPIESATARLDDPAGNKARLLRTWSAPTVHMTKLGEHVDISHGPYAPTTGCVAGARVCARPPGIVLEFAGQRSTASKQPQALWTCYCETRDWNRTVGVATVGDLNQSVLEDRVERVVEIAEALHEKKLAEIADTVASRQPRVKVVFVAGPSASGKTTFVRRLAVQLRVNGLEPYIIGLDDYYRQRGDCPRGPDGELDFEAFEALDVELFEQQLAALLAGEEVHLPRFDFTRQRPVPTDEWRPLRLGPSCILIIEGIHGLNPRLSASSPETAVFRIFVSALTQLVIDEHNRIFTSDARLLRRIVRDRRYRSTKAAETLMRWPSVRRGERRYIFPHQGQADVMFNTTLLYETSVLKTFAVRYLLEVPLDHPARIQAYRLLRFLDLFVPVFPDSVPQNSVLREFIGPATR